VRPLLKRTSWVLYAVAALMFWDGGRAISEFTQADRVLAEFLGIGLSVVFLVLGFVAEDAADDLNDPPVTREELHRRLRENPQSVSPEDIQRFYPQLQEQHRPLDELRLNFHRRFEPFGGRAQSHPLYQYLLQSKAERIPEFFKRIPDLLHGKPLAIYCDVVESDSVNAFVAKYDDMYFIGITHGAIRAVFDSIGPTLKTMAQRINALAPLSQAALDEIKHALQSYGLSFIIGHEVGHLVLGHIDKDLGSGEITAETSRSTTYIEEAHADMIGAFAMVIWKEDLRRVSDITSPGTAVGLLQLPVACVLSAFNNATGPISRDHGYPHPAARLFAITERLLPLMTSTVTKGTKDPLIGATLGQAHTMMRDIVELVAPDMDSFIRSNIEQLNAELKYLLVETVPAMVHWMKEGTWLFTETPELDEWLTQE
jgi:hypothetical protein